MTFYINFSSFECFQNKKKITKKNLIEIKKILKKNNIEKIEFSVPRVLHEIIFFNELFANYKKILNFDEIKNVNDLDFALILSKFFSSNLIRIKYSKNLEFNIPNEKDHKKKLLKFISIIKLKINEFYKNKIKISLENHQDLDSDDFRFILSKIRNRNFGICFDTANSLATIETPYYFINKFHKRIIHTHLKNYLLSINKDQLILKSTDIETGHLNIVEIYKKLKKLNKSITFSLEIGNKKDRKINLKKFNINNRLKKRSLERVTNFIDYVSFESKKITSYQNKQFNTKNNFIILKSVKYLKNIL